MKTKFLGTEIIRLDALGAIGIARTYSIGGSENRKYYNADDPFYRSDRDLDDMQWTLDHFQTKLLKLEDSMHTKTAKKIARAYKIHVTVHPTIAKGNLAVVYIVFVALFYVFVLACKHLYNFFF
jgi:HD superfamily phosphodiesterase